MSAELQTMAAAPNVGEAASVQDAHAAVQAAHPAGEASPAEALAASAFDAHSGSLELSSDERAFGVRETSAEASVSSSVTRT